MVRIRYGVSVFSSLRDAAYDDELQYSGLAILPFCDALKVFEGSNETCSITHQPPIATLA